MSEPRPELRTDPQPEARPEPRIWLTGLSADRQAALRRCAEIFDALDTALDSDSHSALVQAEELVQRTQTLFARALPEPADGFIEATVRLVRGNCYFAVSHFPQAVADLTDCLDRYYRLDMEALRQAYPNAELAFRFAQAKTLYLLGTTQLRTGNYADAFTMLNQSLALYQLLEEARCEAETLNSLGGIYFHLGDATRALELIYRSLGFYTALGDRRGESAALHNLGGVFQQIGDYPAALRHIQQALALKQQLNDRRGEVFSLIAAGICSEAQETEQAIAYYTRAVELADTLGDGWNKAIAYNNLGSLLTKLGRTDEALAFITQSLLMSRTSGNPSGEAYSLWMLANVYLSQRRTGDALETLHAALALAERLGAKNLMRDIHRNLSDAYRQCGDFERALTHHERLLDLQQDIFNDDADRRIKQLQILHQVQQAQEESDTLRVKNAKLRDANDALSAAIYEMERQKNIAQEARLAAEVANQLKTRFVQIATHDLRNPLQVILGYCYLLDKDGDAPSGSEAAKCIQDSAQKMVHLIDDVLQTSALEAGKLELSLAPVDLSDLVAAVTTYYRSQASKKSQVLVCDIEPDCKVSADAGRLQEVLLNLLSNAVKYSPAGKRIWIEVKKEDVKFATGDGREKKGGMSSSHISDLPSHPSPVIRISIKDEGQGLSNKDMQKVFGEFERLSAQPTGGEASIGLGLSIVKQLVELHGGTVRAESAGKNQGATFTIELPALG